MKWLWNTFCHHLPAWPIKVTMSWHGVPVWWWNPLPTKDRPGWAAPLLLPAVYPREFCPYGSTLPSPPCDLHQYPAHLISESYCLAGAGVRPQRVLFKGREEPCCSGHTWFSISRALRHHYWPVTVNNLVISVLRDYRIVCVCVCVCVCVFLCVCVPQQMTYRAAEIDFHFINPLIWWIHLI